MKLALMQPYLFPYLGYFQLVRESDLFVFYDDVAFIKQGWINRNRILVNGAARYVTVPLAKASSFVPIYRTQVHPERYPGWRRKFFQTLKQCYGTAPHYSTVIDLVHCVMTEHAEDIATLATTSVERCSDYLGIKTKFRTSSQDFGTTKVGGASRIMEICRECRANVYLNAPGGRGLYDRSEFASERIVLSFLQPRLNPYPQGKHGFVPGLSIIDVLMHCSLDQTRTMLAQYTVE